MESSSPYNNDHDLFHRVSLGDEQAFEELVTLYGPVLQKAIFSVIRTPLALKDILQDVFLQLWLNREKLEGLDNPRAWMLKVAYYRSYTWMRNKGVQEKVHKLLETRMLVNPVHNPVEEEALFSETKKYLGQAIDQLSPQAKRIYQLSREGNLKIHEIASLLNISDRTVKNTLSTALKKIRQYLQEQGIVIPVIILLMTKS